MNKKLSKTLTKLIALLLIITLMPSGLGLAISDPRPEPAVPFDDETVSNEAPQVTFLLDQAMALPSGSVFQNGGDRLADLQNDDGGWDWPLDDGNPASASPTNTVGPISRGLAEAYVFTSDTDHLAALQDVGTFLLAKTNNFSPSDGYLAATLDEVFGGTTYTDHVVNNFYDPLAAGIYNRNGAGTMYDTAGYVNLIRTNRSGAIANLAAWDIGIGLVGAASVGADTTAWIAGVKAEIDELNGAGWYDVIGLAGAVYGLAYAGEDYDPIAGEHATASNLNDLGVILASYQISSGGFAWNSNYVIPNDGNETIQETAYAILALAELGQTTYQNVITDAADYVGSVQLGTGGWENYSGSGENNEVTGEALWGGATAINLYNQQPIADPNGPYLGAINTDITFNGTGSSDPDDNPLTYAWEFGDTNAGSGATPAHSYDTPGIYDVCLTVNDGFVYSTEVCTTAVVYDPSGGFVTGGGWIDSPAGAYMPLPVLTEFVTPANVGVDWFPNDTRPGGYTAFVYGPDTPPLGEGSLETGTADGSAKAQLFNYDYIGIPLANISSISYATYRHSNSTNPPAQYPAINMEVDYVGDGSSYTTLVWEPIYTYGQSNLALDTWQTWDTMTPSQTGFNGGWWSTKNIPGVCAFNCFVDWNTILSNNPNAKIKYGFGVNIGSGWNGEFTGAVDALSITVLDDTTTYNFEPVSPPTGKATFGFISKYKKGASVPDGNTEFQFKAGNLNFHSTSYDWLVVTGSDFAKFKGEGTINGEGNYKFQIWAGDGSPDTFRIKIWYEDNGNEIVVYDNGMNQEIGGGSIVVHTK